MNLLKSFAATTGLTPGKSYIYEKLFPLEFDKYIVLDTQSKDPNFHYVFWFRVLELIEPILSEQNIKIVHFIEDRRYHYDHTYIDGNVLLAQKAYLIRKAQLFCGSSKIYSLLASENKIKQCFLKCDYLLENTLVSEEETIHTKDKRKNFLNPTPYQINNIRPEEIAKNILQAITGKEYLFDNTLSIGKVYSTQSLEVIPDCTFKIGNNSKNEIILRMDLFFSEENLATQLGLEPASIVTNKKISPAILASNLKNIKKFYYKIEKDSDASFLDDLEALKLDYDLITTLQDEDLNKEKLKYLNYKKINKLNILDLKFLDGLDKDLIYFKTNKIVIKSGKTFPSKWHCKAGLNNPSVRNSTFSLPSLIDDTFKEDSDYFYFLTKEQL